LGRCDRLLKAAAPPGNGGAIDCDMNSSPSEIRGRFSHSQQLLRSSYIFFFQLPWLPELFYSRQTTKRLKPGLAANSAFTKADLEAYKDASKLDRNVELLP